MNDTYILLKDYSTPSIFAPKGTILVSTTDGSRFYNRGYEFIISFSVAEVTSNTNWFRKIDTDQKFTSEDMRECWSESRVQSVSYNGISFDDYIKSKNQEK